MKILSRMIGILGLIMIIVSGQALAGSASHSSADASHQTTGKDSFKHRQTVEGVKTEFEIMSLASMNMTDPAETV